MQGYHQTHHIPPIKYITVVCGVKGAVVQATRPCITIGSDLDHAACNAVMEVITAVIIRTVISYNIVDLFALLQTHLKKSIPAFILNVLQFKQNL